MTSLAIQRGKEWGESATIRRGKVRVIQAKKQQRGEDTGRIGEHTERNDRDHTTQEAAEGGESPTVERRKVEAIET